MKKKNRIKIFASVMLSAALTACGSDLGSSPPVYQTGFISMDTYISLTVYGDNREKAAEECQKEIERIEGLMSAVDPDSEVSALNGSEGRPVTVSEDVKTVIEAALRIGGESGGALDITLRPVIKEWGFTAGDYKVPSEEALKELLRNVDYGKVGIEGSTVMLPKGFQIDLGAAAKGYAGDKAIETLKNEGIVSAVVNLGGNVQTLGAKPDGTSWNVAVKNPFDESNMCTIKVKDKALVTSGNYERYFEGEDGRRYHHIIDPSDGCPADNGLVSATIVGDRGLDCDALSTAVFVMGSDKAERFWREKGGFEMILVTDDKKILITEGITDSFFNLSDMEVTVITSDGDRQSYYTSSEISEALGGKTEYREEYTDENGFLTEKAVERIDAILSENKKSIGKTYTGLFDFDLDGIPEVYLVYHNSGQGLMPVDVFTMDGKYLGNFKGYCRDGYTRLGRVGGYVYVHNFYEHSAHLRLNQRDRLVFGKDGLQTEPCFKACAAAGGNYPLLETTEYFSENEEKMRDFENNPDKAFVYDDNSLFYRGGEENWVSVCAFDFPYDVSYEEMAEKTAETYDLYIKWRREAAEILNSGGVTSEYADRDIAYFFDDFDGDGKYEAFFCADGSRDMYFINGSHYEKIEPLEEQHGGYWYYYRAGGLLIAQPSGNSAKCRVFGVNGDKWCEPECSFGGMLLDGFYGPETGTFFLYQSKYDASSQGGGHTWKPYLFYESGKEINGVPVDREELSSVRQGESITAELERLEEEGFTVCEIFCFSDKYYAVNYIMPVWGENENGETIFYTNRNYYNWYLAWNTFAVIKEEGSGRYASGSIFE